MWRAMLTSLTRHNFSLKRQDAGGRRGQWRQGRQWKRRARSSDSAARVRAGSIVMPSS